MAEDVDPEIAAALAKLAQQDAGSVGNAEAALEWIVGELGLEAITQEHVQNFCWYQLPMKWLISHEEKLRVAVALGKCSTCYSCRGTHLSADRRPRARFWPRMRRVPGWARPRSAGRL
jgi:hypothetical protein